MRWIVELIPPDEAAFSMHLDHYKPDPLLSLERAPPGKCCLC